MSGRYWVAIAGAVVSLLGLSFAAVDYVTTNRMSMIGAAISCIGVIGIAVGLLADFVRIASRVSEKAAKARVVAIASRDSLAEERRRAASQLRRSAEEARQEAQRHSEERRKTALLHPDSSTASERSRFYQSDNSAAGCLTAAGLISAVIGCLGAVVILINNSHSRDALALGLGVGLSAFVTGAVLFGLASIVNLLIEACALLRRLDDRGALQMRDGRSDSST